MIFLLLACPAPDTGEPAVLVEDCATAGDEDEDGLSDCADPECPPCEDCATPGDEDGDGRFDCDDRDCWASGLCPEKCGWSGDQDGDGLDDCEDPDCPPCADDCATPGDEDEDGLADCLDPDCWAPGVCPEDCDAPGDQDGDGLERCTDPDCPPCEDCSRVGDEDGDGLSDCDDPDCACEICDTPEDEDGDRAEGCWDVDCWFTTACSEDCENGLDDDGDGRVDCDDVACTRSGLCPERCDNLFDDDGDAEVDEGCPTCPREDCDGSDGDGDGLVGCDDPDCQLGPREGACGDGIDDDCDGLVDCEDPDCPGVASEDCPSLAGPWRDADCDGLYGDDDPDCGGAVVAVEQCANGADDDADGLIDCEDGECAGRAICDELCDNHVDDDVDGLTDCWDDDCWGPACVGATAARVMSGTGRRAEVRDEWVYGPTSQVADFRASGVAGVLRVADGYGGTATSCTWTVGVASAESRVREVGSSIHVWTTFDDGAIARCDVGVPTACAAASPGFLPWGAVVRDSSLRFIDGTRPFVTGTYGHALRYAAKAGPGWYVPLGPVAVDASSWEEGAYFGWYPQWAERSREIASFPLGEGAWYYAPPAP